MASLDERTNLTWQDVDKAVEQLKAQMARVAYRPTRIVSIGRGGMVPAGILAYALQVSEVRLWQVRRSSGVASIVSVDPQYPASWNDPNTLLVDDILDSGRTIYVCRDHLTRAMSATLFHKHDPERDVTYEDHTPHFRGHKLNTQDYVYFPWDPYKGEK